MIFNTLKSLGKGPFLSETVPLISCCQITLVEETNALEEIIVVGYGTQKKSSLTGSVTKADNEQLTQVSVANSTELLAKKSILGVLISEAP